MPLFQRDGNRRTFGEAFAVGTVGRDPKTELKEQTTRP